MRASHGGEGFVEHVRVSEWCAVRVYSVIYFLRQVAYVIESRTLSVMPDFRKSLKAVNLQKRAVGLVH